MLPSKDLEGTRRELNNDAPERQGVCSPFQACRLLELAKGFGSRPRFFTLRREQWSPERLVDVSKVNSSEARDQSCVMGTLLLHRQSYVLVPYRGVNLGFQLQGVGVYRGRADAEVWRLEPQLGARTVNHEQAAETVRRDGKRFLKPLSPSNVLPPAGLHTS